VREPDAVSARVDRGDRHALANRFEFRRDTLDTPTRTASTMRRRLAMRPLRYHRDISNRRHAHPKNEEGRGLPRPSGNRT
jgi:hypothetical protein